MKVILSRKGFDSGAGGYPSPIFPDGSMLSLPIPSTEDMLRYADVAYKGDSLSTWMRRLGLPARLRRERCHLDPDLDRDSAPRGRDWRPLFGSVGAAGTHLLDNGIGPGDLFLFFGWFRHVAPQGRGKYRYVGPDLHVIFGGMRVRHCWRDTFPEYVRHHPHSARAYQQRKGNVVFEAANDHTGDLAGAWTFPFSDHRVLTRPGYSRSRWALPKDVFADRPMTYHSPASWKSEYFQSAARGQEFILDADRALLEWCRSIVAKGN